MSESSNIARHRAALREAGGTAWRERRAEIKAAAARLFRQRGYPAATLQDIAQELGTDRASLYYYVSGKEELFEEIVSDAIEVSLALTIEIRDGPGPGAERLRRLIESLMRGYDGFFPVLSVLWRQNLPSPRTGEQVWPVAATHRLHEWEQALVEIVRSGQRDGTISDSVPPWLIAYAVSGLVSWSGRWSALDGGELSPERIAGFFADMALDGLARTPAQ